MVGYTLNILQGHKLLGAMSTDTKSAAQAVASGAVLAYLPIRVSVDIWTAANGDTAAQYIGTVRSMHGRAYVIGDLS